MAGYKYYRKRLILSADWHSDKYTRILNS